jgi:predicted TIM-barrel fold metal-dependent hydrolase
MGTAGLDFPVISADGHIDMEWLPTDLFVSEAPDAFRARVPAMTATPDGNEWTYEGGFVANPTKERHWDAPTFDRMEATGLYRDAAEGKLRPGTPELRLGDQDLDGVAGEVIYGILMLDRLMAHDQEALALCFHIYNEWVADFCHTAPDRLVALGLVPTADPEAAAGEVHRIAQLGLRGVELRPLNTKMPIWHESWEPLWAAAADAQLPLHFHATNSGVVRTTFGGSDVEEAKYAHTVVRPLRLSTGKMANSEWLGSMIYSGALDRHPDLRVVLAESDAGWLPHYLDRMDRLARDLALGDHLSKRPSDYWYRQCRVTFQDDPVALELLHRIGEDNVMWGNDYPHADGVWPRSGEVLEEFQSCLSDSSLRKLVHDNAAELYGFAEAGAS